MLEMDILYRPPYDERLLADYDRKLANAHCYSLHKTLLMDSTLRIGLGNSAGTILEETYLGSMRRNRGERRRRENRVSK